MYANLKTQICEVFQLFCIESDIFSKNKFTLRFAVNNIIPPYFQRLKVRTPAVCKSASSGEHMEQSALKAKTI